MLSAVQYMYIKATSGVKKLLKEEKGAADMVGIVLILVVVVGLAIIFRDKIGEMVKRIIDSIAGKEDTLKEFK